MLCLRIFAFLATLSVAFAAVALMASDPKPGKYANSEGCYMAQYDELIKFGESYKPTGGYCAGYTCYDSGFIQIATCGALGIPDGCETADGDSSLSYPKCCGGFKCKQSDGSYKTVFPY